MSKTVIEKVLYLDERDFTEVGLIAMRKKQRVSIRSCDVKDLHAIRDSRIVIFRATRIYAKTLPPILRSSKIVKWNE